jgi:hypothetical protein
MRLKNPERLHFSTQNAKKGWKYNNIILNFKQMERNI